MTAPRVTRTAPRVVVETPRPEPCTYAGCVVPHMDRRVLQAGEYVLVEKIDEDWPDEAAQKVIDFLRLADTAENLDRVGFGALDALAGGSP